MVTTTSTEVETAAYKGQQQMPEDQTQKNRNRLLGFLACTVWIGTWLVMPLATTSFIWMQFGFLWACAWWITAGMLAPAVPPSPAVRDFFRKMLYWVESSKIIGSSMKNTSGKPTLYCHHPHGIVCISAVVHGSPPGVKALVAPAVFLVPFCRQLMELMGSVPADKESMQKALKTRNDFAIVPGGVAEVALTSPNAERAYIMNRKGFIKYAMQFGYDLQPCYHFGETQQYSVMWPLDEPFFLKLRIWVANRTQLAICALFGDWAMPLIPRRSTNCLTVVGDRIHVPPCENPTDEQVNLLHQTYVERLQRLYNGHRHLLPEYRHKDLELW